MLVIGRAHVAHGRSADQHISYCNILVIVMLVIGRAYVAHGRSADQQRRPRRARARGAHML